MAGVNGGEEADSGVVFVEVVEAALSIDVATLEEEAEVASVKNEEVDEDATITAQTTDDRSVTITHENVRDHPTTIIGDTTVILVIGDIKTELRNS